MVLFAPAWFVGMGWRGSCAEADVGEVKGMGEGIDR